MAYESVNNNLKFTFNDSDFTEIADIANMRFGLCLPLEKKPLIYARLFKRVQHHGFVDFSDYIKLIKSDLGVNEMPLFLSSLTTNITHFFRENHHFDLLRQKILPKLIDKAKKGFRVRIWSAACSSGEEPYSIAMCINSIYQNSHNLDIKILATDIDQEVLKKARLGRYPSDMIGDIPEIYNNNSTFTIDDKSGYFEFSSNLKSLIAFANLNLISTWPIKKRFDVIFCRNVVIYFDRKNQSNLWLKFYEHMQPDAYLFIGHSERISGTAKSYFNMVGATSFQRSG